jgi:hypothetical protein
LTPKQSRSRRSCREIYKIVCDIWRFLEIVFYLVRIDSVLLAT